MRDALVILLGILALTAIACASRHPVQRVSGRVVPLPGCTLRGDQVEIDGDTLVAWACPDGLRLTKKDSGEVVEFVSWTEVRR